MLRNIKEVVDFIPFDNNRLIDHRKRAQKKEETSRRITQYLWYPDYASTIQFSVIFNLWIYLSKLSGPFVTTLRLLTAKPTYMQKHSCVENSVGESRQLPIILSGDSPRANKNTPPVQNQ